jgi:hypothetical protein
MCSPTEGKAGTIIMSKFGLLVNMINAEPRICMSTEKYQSMKLTIHPHPALRLKICGVIPPLPICLQDKHRNNSISIITPVKHSVCTASNKKTM